MKRTLRTRLTAVLAVTLCMAFMLTACGNTSTDNTTADNSNVAPEVQETAETSDTITFSEFFGSLTEPLVMYGFNNSSIADIIVIEPKNGKVYEYNSHELPDTALYKYDVSSGNSIAVDVFENSPIHSKEDLTNEIDEEAVIAFVKSGLEGKPLPKDEPLVDMTEEEITYVPDYMYRYTTSEVLKDTSSNNLNTWGCKLSPETLDKTIVKGAVFMFNNATTHEMLGDISYTKMAGYYFKDTDLTINKTIVPDADGAEPFVFNATEPDVSVFETYSDWSTDDIKVYRTEEAIEREKAKMVEKEAAEADQPETESEQETEVDWEDVW